MNKRSIKIYPKNRNRAELVLKTDSKTMWIKDLKQPMTFKNKMKLLGESLNKGGTWLLIA